MITPVAQSTSAPSKVIAVHLTYRSRAAERGKTPAFPSYFLKPVSSIAGSGDPVARPRGCELLAFEGEIALIIGRPAHQIEAADGWSHVQWVTAANDFGVYDLRYADNGSNVRSKGVDGFTPLGPDLIDASSVDPTALRLRTWVNGDLVQDACTGDELIFPLGALVADLARLMTLNEGDVILTGTPTGSTVVYPGDVVEVEVTTDERSSGRLRSPIVQSSYDLPSFGAMPRVDDDSRSAAHGAAAVDPAAAVDRVEARFGTAARDGLQSVSTATLASQLRKRGLDGCMLDGLSSTKPGQRMVGFARTVSYLPLREDLSPAKSAGLNAQKQAVDSIGPGEVLVIGARGELNAGTIGDILALRVQVRGAAGIITDGALRDSAAIAALDIPTYSRSNHPAVLGRRHVPWQTDVAVACAGALVQPGDLLVGDADGVVVLPADMVADIVAAAVAQEREERFIIEQVAEGASIDGLYPLNDNWRRTYERWNERDPEA
jgi:regulator of RNase E activity RraA/2-keto-4-pentenoate hydratase/2-oxohepta-3-ene-1,7-dioic acid hydratase in catechol pathway